MKLRCGNELRSIRDRRVRNKLWFFVVLCVHAHRPAYPALTRFACLGSLMNESHPPRIGGASMPTRLVLLAGFVLVPLSTAPAEEPKPTRDEVPKLIENLGSKRYAEREAAAKRLALLDAVPPELEAATQSPNAEVSRRAKSIIAAINKRREKEII